MKNLYLAGCLINIPLLVFWTYAMDVTWMMIAFSSLVLCWIGFLNEE